MSKGYRIGVVEVRNFGPYEHAKYDLSRPGLTVVEGEFHGHGCDSNGSGKSYIIEAPVWCVWGETLRPKLSKGDVVRHLFDRLDGQLMPNATMPKDGCSVVTHLVGGPQPVKVERYQGHSVYGNRVRLFIDGVDVTQGRDAMTQAAINKLVGLDHRAAINSVFFGASEDARGFFSATDAERKLVMDRVIGLEVYAHALEITRAQRRALAETKSGKEARLATLVETLAAQERLMAEVSCQAETERREWDVKLNKGRAASLRAHEVRLEGAVERSREALGHVEQAYKDALRAFEAADAEYARKRSALDHRLQDAARQSAEAAAESRLLGREASKWNEMAGRRCVTCLQVVPAIEARKLKAIADVAYVEKSKAKEEYAAEEARIRQVLDALVAPARPESPELEAARARSNETAAELKQCQRALADTERHVKALEGERDAAKRRERQATKEVERVRDELNTTTVELAALEERDAHLAFWVDGFGNGGIKSFLIENEIPTINAIATSYARRLLGPGAQVKLSATRELKTRDETREELTVQGIIPGCTGAYATASKGQKKRLDLCLLLAFRKVVSDRSAKAFDQFFADELFDGLDETGEEFVVELLRDLAKACPVILVTHSARLKSVGNRVLRVEHRDGVSTVKALRA